MALIFWAKSYITLTKKRETLKEKWIDLSIDLTLAILFSIAFVDLFFSIPDALRLIELIRDLGV